jgi:hypothetical protein
VTRRADLITSLVLLVLICAYLWQASRYNADARLIPFFVGGAALFVVLAQIFRSQLKSIREAIGKAGRTTREHDATYVIDTLDGRRLFGIVAWTILLATGIYLFDFIIAVPIFLILMFLYLEKKITIVCITVTISLTLISWIFTSYFLARDWGDAYIWRMIL